MPVSLDIAKVVNERPERLFFLSVSEGIAPGSAAAFLMPEGDVQVAAAGILGLDNTTPVTDETIFYIASCTEPVTSVAALQLVERGLVALNEPAERYVLPLADLDALASFIERLWRSLKFECVYLHAFETGSELRAGLGRWINYYNTARPHSTHGGKTPHEAYGRAQQDIRLAA